LEVIKHINGEVTRDTVKVTAGPEITGNICANATQGSRTSG